MKGVVLAGGTGKRLQPLTKTVNKHLLPIYDHPMIHFPIETLIKSNISDIIIVTDKRKVADFMSYLGSGEEFGVNFTYALQDSASGIADALRRTKSFCQDDRMVVILGDNIFQGDYHFNFNDYFNSQAKIFLKKVSNPQRFGVAVLDNQNRLVNLVEKPTNKISNYAVTGLYEYDSSVFDIIDSLSPSDRHELEITDVNKIYLQRNKLSYEVYKGEWIDAGTIESLYKAQVFRRNFITKQKK